MLGFSRKKKADLFDSLYRGGRETSRAIVPAQSEALQSEFVEDRIPTVSVSSLPGARYQFRFHDGEKFPGGFGPTLILETDYWTLRARSAQLYKTNIFARGIIRKMVTNEINTGLELECTPEETVLGLQKGALEDWTEDVEIRFGLWANAPHICDVKRRCTFGQLQTIARREAIVVGDVLVTLQQDAVTGMPRVKLLNGAAIQTPLNAAPEKGNRIVHGVELDPDGNQVAYWVRGSETGTLQDMLTYRRLPAYGEKTGRRLAWLVYGTDKRLDEVRGEPILSLALQSLRDIDRYRDALQRKAVINSLLAMFIQKDSPEMGTTPFAGAAVRQGTEAVVDNTGQTRHLSIQEHIPGIVFDELQTGEKPVAFRAQIGDEKLDDVQRAMMAGIALGFEIPPEIIWGEFASNYSASQAAIHQYKIYLRPVRIFFAASFCKPVYADWFESAVLTRRIDAPGFAEARRNLAKYEQSEAWLGSDWAGQVMPSLKLTDTVKAYGDMCDQGFISRDHASREINGTKFSKNVKRLAVENAQLAEARKPLLEAEAASQPKPEPPPQAPEQDDDESDDEE